MAGTIISELAFGVAELFHASPDMMAVVAAADQLFLRANGPLCSLLGYREEELVGRSVFDLVHPADLLVGRKAFGHKNQAFERLTLRLGTKSGRQHFIEWSGTPLSNGWVFLVARDVTEERQRQDELYQLAHFDAVTSLPNRLLFRDRVTHGLAQARREGRMSALVFIDLDNFKPVNDTYGHAVGDLVLRVVADRLRNAVRDTDTVTRLGGDEFVVFLSLLKKRVTLRSIQRRLFRAVRTPVKLPEGGEVKITASCGTAVFPDDGSDMDELLLRADERMYKQKSSKRE